MKEIFTNQTNPFGGKRGLNLVTSRFYRGLILCTLLLTIGVGQTWAWTINGRVYYDNTASNWSTSGSQSVQFFPEKSDGSAGLLMTKLDHTKLFYWSGSWGDGAVSDIRFACVASGSAWGWGGNSSWDRLNNNNSTIGMSGTWGIDVNGKSVLFRSAGAGSKTSAVDLAGVDSYDDYSGLNFSQTVEKYTSTDNGSSYSKQSVNSATITITPYKLTAEGSVSNSSNTGTINDAATTSVSKDAVYTGEVTLSATPNSGYVFVGWYDDSDELISTANPYTYNAPQSTKTIHAHIKNEGIHDVTVSYMCGVQSLADNSTEENVGEITARNVTAPAINDHNFSSWSAGNGITLNSSSTTNPANINTKASGTYTLTANYTLKTCTVSVVDVQNAQGDGTQYPMTYDYGEEAYYYEMASTPENLYFRFVHGDGGKWAPNWKSEGYNVYSASIGGGKVTCATDVHEWDFKPTIHFDGAAGSTIRIWFDFTNKQAWVTEQEFTVSITDDGHGTASPSSVSAGRNTPSGDITATPSTGYAFNNWTVTSGGANIVIANSTANPTTVTAASAGTVQANFSARHYDVVLDANGGEGAGETVEAIYDAAMPTSDKSSVALVAPTKTGYNFAGYYDDSDAGEGTQYYTNALASAHNWDKAKDTTLYAHWTAKTYTVTLSQSGETGYGSAGANASVTATFDAAMPTMGSAPVGTTGYKFAGYFTEHNGAGTQYYGADGSSTNNWDIAKDTTLYAYFKKAVITSLAHTVIVPQGVGITLDVNPTIEPASGVSGNLAICWSLLYDNDTEVSTILWSVASYTEGNTKPNQVRFTLNGLAEGTYKVQAVLKANGSAFDPCSEGTTLHTEKSSFRVKGNNTVTVRYVDNTSGDELLSSTTVAVPSAGNADVPAMDIIGYSFVSWSLGDGLTQNSLRGDTINISANYDGILTARYNKKKTMVYFNNTVGWDTVFVYFYNNASSNKYWANGVGSGANKQQIFSGNKPFFEMYYGGMKRVAPGSNIWYFDYKKAGMDPSHISSNIAFAKKDQAIDKSGASDAEAFFYETEAIFREDYDSVHLPMYVPLTTPTEMLNSNTTKYYQKGYWMNYPDRTGYILKIFDGTGGGASLVKEEEFAFASNKAMPMSITTDLEGGHTYGFKIYRDQGNSNDANCWFGNNFTMSNGHSGDTGQPIWEFTTSKNNCGLSTTSAGNYTFTLTYGLDADENNYNYHVGVHYPESTGDFRVQYNDTNHTNWRTSAVLPAGALRDTVSYYVRHNKSPYIRVQKCTATYDNGVTTVTWDNENSGADLLPDTISASGVYNFIFTKSEGTLVLEKVEPYTGNFYIRVDGAGTTNWDDYRATDHMMTYSEYSFKQTENPYSHYFMEWRQVDDRAHLPNIKFVVANDYSPCISDTITQDGIADNYVNAEGFLCRDANIRFMYNYKTNEASRRYIDGAFSSSGTFLVILSDDDKINVRNKANTSDSIAGADVIKFNDNGNWVYEVNVSALPGAQYKLKSTYGEAATSDPDKNGEVTQYFKGGADSYATLLGGTGETHYQIRLLYDFKTNRLVTAYMPSGTINDNLEIHADIMFLREHQGDIDEISFAEGKSISEIEHVYSVLQFNKWTLNNRSKAEGHALLSLSRYERDLFYVSFPFDVNASDIIGFGTYGQHWILEYYDGAARAKEGYWADTRGFWKFVTPAMKNSFTMKAGTGYIVALDLDELWYTADNDHSSIWDNTDVVEIIFPGTVSAISNTSVTYTMPEHWYDPAEHTTHSDDRTNKDSHWNVLGVPTYHNMAAGAGIAYANNTWINTEGVGPKFIYTWNSTDNSLTATTSTGFEYKAMHAYIVQYFGDVTFTTSTNPAPSSVAAQRSAVQEVEFRLELKQDDESADQTFVRLSNDDKVSAGFAFGEDLSKEFNKNKANLYTFIADVQAAGNCMPMSEQTTVVPVGVKIAAAGDYTFTIPESTKGIGVILVDSETGIRTNLSALDYTIALEPGTYDERFTLEISPVRPIGTDIDSVQDDASDNVRKVLIDNVLYIVKDGKMFDARGAVVK